MSCWLTLRDKLSISLLLYRMILGIFSIRCLKLAMGIDFVAMSTSFSLHTLRDRLSSIDDRIGSISILFNSLAISSIALFSSWPACSDGILVEGGLDRIEIMFIAAYFRKSNNFTKRNGIACGKNSTISEFSIDFVLGI